MICEVFAHSPVFRIGGDEFVVVLKDRDYENVETLREQFYQRMETQEWTEPWYRVSAAIGYAKKRGAESHVDVFKRADQDMYREKHRLKMI